MECASLLLFALGILGALDIALYHSISHGIRQHHDSRAELLVHSLRGPTYAALFLAVPNLELRGAWFFALLALYGADVAISIVDFAIERRSRERLGGLPSGEYVLHIFIAMVFGALVASTLFEGWAWAAEPSAILYRPAEIPGALRGILAVMAVGVFASGLQDLLAARRLAVAGARR